MAHIKPTFMRTAYNYDMNEAGDESALQCKDKTLTQQHFKEEADINTIVQRFHLTGELPTDVRMPMNGDFSGVFDFQSAMNAIRAAEESFAAMPAQVRSRFQNNPAAFVAFCSDPENTAEAIKMGLATARPVPDAPKPPEEPKPGTPPPAPPKTGT